VLFRSKAIGVVLLCTAASACVMNEECD